jgi:hypothetical protein
MNLNNVSSLWTEGEYYRPSCELIVVVFVATQAGRSGGQPDLSQDCKAGNANDKKKGG